MALERCPSRDPVSQAMVGATASTPAPSRCVTARELSSQRANTWHRYDPATRVANILSASCIPSDSYRSLKYVAIPIPLIQRSQETNMKALSLEAPKHWKRLDIAAPERPAPGEALVRVHNVGI